MYWHDELAGITYKGENYLYYINGAAQISERYLEAYNEEHIAQIVFGVIFAVTSLLFIADFIIYFVIAKPADKDKAQKPKAQATPNIKDSVEQLIGNTPLVRLEKTERLSASRAKLFAKLEMLNPSGSIKDRAALAFVYDAENRGLLFPGATIVEPTSGNTGIGLAMIAAKRGYKLILTMPETMSKERQKLLKAYGAEIVLTDGKKGMQGAIERAQMIKAEIGAFMPEQFDNQANANAHYTSTGPELWLDTAGNIDILVAGVGTGGTISGAGRYLKAQKSDIKVVAVEPKGSPVLSGGSAGAHGIQGIGAGFIPAVLDKSAYDEVFTVTEEQAYIAARALAKTEGILAGISSGAALHAAIELSRMEANADKNIVVILPDSGDRYLSTPLYSAEETAATDPPKQRKTKHEAK
ncbi:MAG: cysteine synthase A [Clostridiales bacterium]|nr:cysteine synthase A [Clostridiales bacterium]